MSVRYILFAATLLAVGKTCYWNDKCTYTHFGSKSVYDDVRGDIRDVDELKGCEPVAVWALFRHGTRQPSSANVPNMLRAADYKDEIVRSHLEGRGQLCAQDISNLQNWSWHQVTKATAGHLTPEGYEELFNLGTRFHQKFRPLLQKLEQHHFRPTLEQRTIESAKAFILGLDLEDYNFKLSDPTDRDDVLRPYYYCTKHNVEVYCGPRSTDEMNNYHKTKEFQEVLEKVKARIGLEKELSPPSVTGLYDLCRYFRAFSPSRSSPWCALFSAQDLEVLEYLNDLRHYFRNGYGSPINQKLGKPVLKDLYENFHSVVKDSSKKFVGYFSHDSLLQMMFTALGLFRDYPEISGFERNPDRKWRTSFMTPFAANFVAVLHNCSSETQSSSYQVQFLMNEKELHLCPARTCSWSEFVTKFEPFLDSDLSFCDHYADTTSAPLKSTGDLPA